MLEKYGKIQQKLFLLLEWVHFYKMLSAVRSLKRRYMCLQKCVYFPQKLFVLYKKIVFCNKINFYRSDEMGCSFLDVPR
jgi:hypothetical protein